MATAYAINCGQVSRKRGEAIGSHAMNQSCLPVCSDNYKNMGIPYVSKKACLQEKLTGSINCFTLIKIKSL